VHAEEVGQFEVNNGVKNIQVLVNQFEDDGKLMLKVCWNYSTR
jgi:hypothetical protein